MAQRTAMGWIWIAVALCSCASKTKPASSRSKIIIGPAGQVALSSFDLVPQRIDGVRELTEHRPTDIGVVLRELAKRVAIEEQPL